MRGIGDKPYKYLLDFNIFVFDINLLNYRQDQLKGSGIGFYVGDEHSYACKDIKSRTENDDERTEEQKRWEK